MNARQLLLALLLVTAGLPPSALAAVDELQRLRGENLRLQQQVEQLRQQCAVPVPAAAAVAPAAPAAVTTAVPAPAPQAVPPAVAAAVELPYSNTGCRKRKSGGDLRWKERANWEDLSRGMSAAEVEDRLGIEHFNVVDGSRTGWQYGKCEARVRGTVVFEQGRVLFWDMPTF